MLDYQTIYFRFVHDKGVLTHSHPGQPNPAHQRTTPSPAHQNPATSSLTHGHALLPSPAHHHPAHQPLCSPNVEILPVIGGATTTSPITAHKTRMPLDELSMTTVHHPIKQEDRKSCIVPIKPKVKKEAWQVSITVKEGRPKTSTGGEVAVKSKAVDSDQPHRLSIPQISAGSFSSVSSPTFTSLASIPSCTSSMPTNPGSYHQSVTHFSHPSTPTTIIDTSMEEPTDLTRKPEPTAQPYSRQELTSPSSGGQNEQTPVIARKSRVFEASALDYSAKDRKSPNISATAVVKQEKEGASGEQANNERNVPVKSARQARVERKRSLEEKEEAHKKEATDSKPVVTRNGKKQKVADVDDEQNIDDNYENTDNKNQVKKNASKTPQVANFQDQDENRKGNKKPESKQEQLDKKKKAAQLAAKSAADQPPARSKRLQRLSVSPEPLEDEEEEIPEEPEPEPELPQFETRTSSGRRKVIIIFMFIANRVVSRIEYYL